MYIVVHYLLQILLHWVSQKDVHTHRINQKKKFQYTELLHERHLQHYQN